MGRMLDAAMSSEVQRKVGKTRSLSMFKIDWSRVSIGCGECVFWFASVLESRSRCRVQDSLAELEQKPWIQSLQL